MSSLLPCTWPPNTSSPIEYDMKQTFCNWKGWELDLKISNSTQPVQIKFLHHLWSWRQTLWRDISLKNSKVNPNLFKLKHYRWTVPWCNKPDYFHHLFSTAFNTSEPKTAVYFRWLPGCLWSSIHQYNYICWSICHHSRIYGTKSKHPDMSTVFVYRSYLFLGCCISLSENDGYVFAYVALSH